MLCVQCSCVQHVFMCKVSVGSMCSVFMCSVYVVFCV